MSLSEKTRPQKLEEMILPATTMNSLKSLLNIIKTSQDNIQGILMSGPSGYGKTTAARIFAKEILAKSASPTERDIVYTHNILEINGADHRKIEDARDIAQFMRGTSIFSNTRIVILDEAQQLTKDAQNCILKPIEENPRACIFLCSTEPAKIIKPLKTRCHTVEFSSFDQENESDIDTIVKYLDKVLMVDAHFIEKNLLRQVAKSQPNSIRSFINKAELVAYSGTDNEEEVASIIQGISDVEEKEIIDITRNIIKLIRNKSQFTTTQLIKEWVSICKQINNNVKNFESLRIVMLSYLTTVITTITPYANNNFISSFMALGNTLDLLSKEEFISKDRFIAIIFNSLFKGD